MNQLLLRMSHRWCQFWWDVMEFMSRLVGDEGFVWVIEKVRCPRCGWEGTPDAFDPESRKKG